MEESSSLKLYFHLSS